MTAVLTGGSAATIWSSENYQSHDCDFVITFEAQSAPSGQVLKELGFTLHGQVYRHSASPFTLDFLRTPLSVGNEIITDWETLTRFDEVLHILSPTDSCRDRLAAYYHWNDFSSLHVAVMIARFKNVDLCKIKSWSQREGAEEKFQRFHRQLGG